MRGLQVSDELRLVYSGTRNVYAQIRDQETPANIADIVDIVATGAYTEMSYSDAGDVTDLLLDLDYGYELFPSFAGNYASDRKRIDRL